MLTLPDGLNDVAIIKLIASNLGRVSHYPLKSFFSYLRLKHSTIKSWKVLGLPMTSSLF